MNDEIEIGNNNLPKDAEIMFSDFLAQLSEKYEFVNGETAAYWHLSSVLLQHLGRGRE
jgi:hypothetical protein